MTAARRRVGWGICAVLVAVAGLIPVDPIVSGDTYCGRLYFDSQWTVGCRDELAVRAGWFLALAGTAVAIAAGLLVAAGGPHALVAGALGAVALAATLVGFNRLLQPTDPRKAFCGSVLNPHGSLFDRAYEETCDDLLDRHRNAAIVAFGVALVSSAGAVAARNPRRRPDAPG